MYYDFFGFREPPFSIAPDPRYLYLSDRHKEALAHLMYGVKGQGGFIVITGEVGTGKTTVSRCFIENVPENVDIALVLNPRLSARELLSSVCDELEIDHEVGASIKQLVDLINQDLLKAHAAGRHKVLMIDEAQNLSAEVLEQLRLLTNLETAEKKLLQIVLLGQPELQQMLALPELRQLNQRVTARYHLDAIEKTELPAYLRYRLSVAGLRGDIFSPSAIKRLYKESQGVPRLINLISDRALLGAYAEGEHEITSSHIRQAAREVRGNDLGPIPYGNESRRPAMQRWLMVASSALLAVILTVWLVEQWPMSTAAISKAETAPDSADPENQLGGSVERTEPEASSMPAPDSAGPSVRASEPTTSRFSFDRQSTDLSTAFQLLFSIWGREYQPSQSPIACDFAQQAGLGCLERQGSRRSLEFLDRPVILRLHADGANQAFIVIKSLHNDQARVLLPDGEQVLSFASIEPYWFGEYRILWRLPEYQTEDRFYGSENGQSLWIGARMMELADRLSLSESEGERIKRLASEDQVRWYQKQKGLLVDGIAGAMTIIQMNNDLDSEVPRLVPASLPEEG
ncbi:General secretion pathway protein A [Marinobacter nitratireducens]|uniref:General secretion pathway protein A n=1 Tax=Marinobacter nitratireducens TaxID=1137280 RepID=A0A072N3J4_9GAMM|nr:ExeA family protein [Marinobacter nitratireducens]KEF32279.1 General secretion pathway protein A [Marinobacter nitratireducens]